MSELIDFKTHQLKTNDFLRYPMYKAELIAFMDGENANQYLEKDYVTPDIKYIQNANRQQQGRIKEHATLSHHLKIAKGQTKDNQNSKKILEIEQKINNLIWMGASMEKITMETFRADEKEAMSQINKEQTSTATIRKYIKETVNPDVWVEITDAIQELTDTNTNVSTANKLVVAIATLDKLMKGDAEHHSIVLTQRLEELQQAKTWAETQALVTNITTLYNQAKMCAKMYGIPQIQSERWYLSLLTSRLNGIEMTSMVSELKRRPSTNFE
jgi:hypothetical protein